MARNKSLDNALGNYIALIDDDEIPDTAWLYNLYSTCTTYGVDGVLGPVKPYFEHVPPPWVLKGRFFERPTYPTGYKLDWSESRTGNVLFKREILNGIAPVFRPEFGTGSEDVDFFKRVMHQGSVFVWCNEASVFEIVPPARCSSGYLLRRALLRGSNFPKRQAMPVLALSKSLVAVPVYTLAMPLFALLGQHVLIKYLIKLCDHGSRLCAFVGWQLEKEKEM
jgi:glycosyltransferase involved in cell wall biosynthesis